MNSNILKGNGNAPNLIVILIWSSLTANNLEGKERVPAPLWSAANTDQHIIVIFYDISFAQRDFMPLSLDIQTNLRAGWIRIIYAEVTGLRTSE